MSKKNNKATKARYYEHGLQREKEAALKKQQKAQKRQAAQAAKAVPAATKTISKNKKRGIRIRKGVHVKGIKIVDAASKKRALELLKAKHAIDEMETDLPKEKPRKLLKKKSKKTAKASATAADGPRPME